jgi:FeS assembly SUF system regulator
MVRLTNLADYAVVVLAHAAGTSASARLSAGGVAEVTGIPLPTVAKVAGLLSKAGLLTSQRGAGGGFQLARAPQDISIAEVIEAVDGPIALTQCVEHDDGHTHGNCAHSSMCSMRPHWQLINLRVRDALAGLSLADVARKPFAFVPEFA